MSDTPRTDATSDRTVEKVSTRWLGVRFTPLFLQIALHHLAEHDRDIGKSHQRLALKGLRIDCLLRSQRMVAWQNDDDRLLRDHLVGHVRLRLDAQEAKVNLAVLQRLGQIGRVHARHLELDFRQLGPENARDVGEPVDLLARQESDREDRFRRAGSAASGLKRLGSLADRDARVGQKGATGVGQLDAARPADEERRADLDLQIAKLAAERGLGGMQPLLGRDGDAALLGHGDEIAEMPELHTQPMPSRYGKRPYKVFLADATST